MKVRDVNAELDLSTIEEGYDNSEFPFVVVKVEIWPRFLIMVVVVGSSPINAALAAVKDAT
jgi:hypothetical protein